MSFKLLKIFVKNDRKANIAKISSSDGKSDANLHRISAQFYIILIVGF